MSETANAPATAIRAAISRATVLSLASVISHLPSMLDLGENERDPSSLFYATAKLCQLSGVCASARWPIFEVTHVLLCVACSNTTPRKLSGGAPGHARKAAAYSAVSDKSLSENVQTQASLLTIKRVIPT